MTDMDIILASGSPRRRELLNTLGLSFTVHPAKGEEIAPDGAGPEEIVKALSRAKAEEVARQFPDKLIIAADTIVYLDGMVLGKPKDEDDAKAMLSKLSGRAHEVYTGVTVILEDKTICESECTKVIFRDVSAEEIASYVASGDPMDKAGAYGIQGKAALMVERLEGDYFNVMGLPLCRLGKMLGTIGVRLL